MDFDKFLTSNICDLVCRAEKSAVLSEDLLELERRVDIIRAVCQDTVRRLAACHPVPHNNDSDKRRVNIFTPNEHIHLCFYALYVNLSRLFKINI